MAPHTIVPIPTPVSEAAYRVSAPAQVAAPTTEPKPKSIPVRRSRTETNDKINHVIDALLSWNTAQENSETQLRISIPTIKGLASAMGANYQPAIQEILKERAEELEDLHSRLLLGRRHNASVRDKDGVLKAIARDYLGLENWQEVKYA